MSLVRRASIVLWKDMLVERRAKETLNALLFFVLLLLFVFQLALGPDRERLAGVLAGLLWLAFVLSGLLGLGRTFLAERENDCWEGLVLAPGDGVRGRPYPDLILTALIRLQADGVANVAALGDTTSDVESARRAGVVIAAGTLTGAHEEEQLRGAGATHVVGSVTDFADLLLRG